MFWTHDILITVMTHVVVGKSTDNAEPLSICFLPEYLHQGKCLFFPEGDQVRDILTSAALSGVLSTNAN